MLIRRILRAAEVVGLGEIKEKIAVEFLKHVTDPAKWVEMNIRGQRGMCSISYVRSTLVDKHARYLVLTLSALV